ncbi:MAG: SPOR domain-containing protein [Candidatus Omnitrophica bacterium]|nr:SPOR domain-containing protein [Candidatus Omnitrophota bacterium]
MEKQPELFGEFNDPRERRIPFGRPSMPEKIFTINLTREKVILAALGSVIALVLMFAFGFERGRKSVLERRIAVKPPIEKPAAMPAVKALKEPAAPVETRPPPTAKKTPQVAPKMYTIQVATFKSKEYAAGEALKLRKKGYLTTVVGVGGYYLVWVGEFAAPKEAQAALNSLKKTYQSSYIRKR